MEGLPRWLSSKESPANADMGSIPGSVRSPGGGNDNPLQYFCLENATDRGAWQATVQGTAEWDAWPTQHAPILLRLCRDLFLSFIGVGLIYNVVLVAVTCFLSVIDSSSISLFFDIIIAIDKVMCVCAPPCLTLGNPMSCSPPGSSVHEIFPHKNTGVSFHFLLQGIIWTQEPNLCLLCLLHWQSGSLPLCHLRVP